MTKLETNALRIAELKGYQQSKAEHVLIRHRVGHNKKEILEEYYSYNGLMPIVFECNADINYRIHIYEECVIFSTADGEMLLPKLKYELEPEFIESLQLAVIKYLELKNG